MSNLLAGWPMKAKIYIIKIRCKNLILPKLSRLANKGHVLYNNNVSWIVQCASSHQCGLSMSLFRRGGSWTQMFVVETLNVDQPHQAHERVVSELNKIPCVEFKPVYARS